ncbi:DUF262 domain-containing protein [Gluconacetobacter azotocaptans]|uniref:DUF262 domain-containing protein n=1 Tax=Gluconacetobacter azotocaptans TaxID=142834 RepID=A0A7W4PEP6_9PROT|nr:DUF262 domain-containing protein [Gluconacetobacter azotocaptans]MBB2190978.1 DUF262 domain-containing protein [Gluconacetobacter azotocaptans]GBQ29992.1 hypothetical protein AA13594_1562 [Gluconacetobacter azotocaptans DSM 13594]
MSAIDFTYKGIGELISAGRLRVPANQREYAWDDEHVEALCSDISDALSESKESYFLGTVVLTKTKDGYLEVVDRQQRLATTTILIAVIRDMLLAMDEVRLAHGIEETYLFGLDLDTEEDTPKFHLNVRDHEFYQNCILPRPSDVKRKAKPAVGTHSNVRIKNAATILRRFLESETKTMTVETRKKHLKDWLSYLREHANLIVLTVSDDVNAYVMFETLNDRGLRVSQADLVKNYLFGQAGNRLDEAKAKWASMIRSLETVDKEDTAIDYLRLVSTLINGLTRERQVFERIKPLTESPIKAVTFLETINSFSNDYVAMLTPHHFKWESYPESIRRSVATLNLLGVTQIRHLMLAVTHHFSKHEADRSFKLFVSWIVRMFIADSGRVGRLESIYASLAHNIHTKIGIRTAEALVQRMAPHVANDRDFRDAFAKCHVSKTKLARYYLMALERSADNSGLPEQVPNEDTKAVNLEHVLPIKPESFDIESFEDAASYTTRLGNLVLLNARLNSSAGNADFTSKRLAFSKSPFVITKGVAEYKKWGPEEIENRQAHLADLAVRTWPINTLGRN